MEDGNYIKTEIPPLITSALAAIPKPDGNIRIIHDLSRPANNSVNHFAEKDPCEYQSFQDALQLVTPESYMAKVDLQWAYRSVAIKQQHQTLTGLQWWFKGDKNPTFLMDRCLPFGARKSPAAFNRLTKSVQRMMERKGFKIVVFLDDFFLCENSFDRCLLSLNTLISLLRSLNFRINWKKVVDPCRNLTFLGINIDLEKKDLMLDPGKAEKLCNTLKDTALKKRLSKPQLQSLAGKLSWACQVTPWGRAHLSPFFQSIRELKCANHKTRLSSALHEEIDWWLACLTSGQNTRPIWDERPCILLAADACNVGGGAICQSGETIYVNWILDRPDLASQHINMKELAMLKETVCHWAPKYPGHHLSMLTDNQAALYIINKGYSKHPVAASLLKSIAVVSLQYNCRVTAQFIPGALNDIPDAISRLHQKGQWERFASLMNMLNNNTQMHTYCQMSQLSRLFIFQRQSILKNWTPAGKWHAIGGNKNTGRLEK